jgi:hypothetical protein
MINFKQQELSQQLFERLQERFPEIELLSVAESPENPQNLWVTILMPEDEDRELALREMAGDLSMDLLLTFGYHITIRAAARKASSAPNAVAVG